MENTCHTMERERERDMPLPCFAQSVLGFLRRGDNKPPSGQSPVALVKSDDRTTIHSTRVAISSIRSNRALVQSSLAFAESRTFQTDFITWAIYLRPGHVRPINVRAVFKP